VAEEQPQQNDHRDWHAQQPKQNSSSHYRFLQPNSDREENAPRFDSFLRIFGPREGTFYAFGISDDDNPIRNSE
jgi:hypothetical protein